MKKILLTATFLGLLANSSAHAQPSLALSLGSGSDADIAQVSLTTNKGFWSHQFQSGWAVKAHLDLNIAQIDGKLAGANKGIVVLGVTPTLRFEPKSSPGFIEFGIGAHYFDEKTINNGKSVGTHFEFGDLLGIGMKFGGKQQFEAGYRIIHYSNAGMSTNNPGLDFHQLRLQYNF